MENSKIHPWLADTMLSALPYFFTPSSPFLPEATSANKTSHMRSAAGVIYQGLHRIF